MDYLKVKNWEEFQHYKDRSPPWIKLHRELLRDYEFSRLQDASKLHLILIWLLASQLDNKIPADGAWIEKQIGVSKSVDINALISSGFLIASKPLADCKQSARPETEAYKEEAEVEAESRKPKKTGKRIPLNWQPSEKLTAWASKERPDIDITKTIESFIDYWIAKTGQAATKLDWDATFRNWVRKENGNSKIQRGNGKRETAIQRSERIEREALARVGINI